MASDMGAQFPTVKGTSLPAPLGEPQGVSSGELCPCYFSQHRRGPLPSAPSYSDALADERAQSSKCCVRSSVRLTCGRGYFIRRARSDSPRRDLALPLRAWPSLERGFAACSRRDLPLFDSRLGHSRTRG